MPRGEDDSWKGKPVADGGGNGMQAALAAASNPQGLEGNTRDLPEPWEGT